MIPDNIFVCSVRAAACFYFHFDCHFDLQLGFILVPVVMSVLILIFISFSFSSRRMAFSV